MEGSYILTWKDSYGDGPSGASVDIEHRQVGSGSTGWALVDTINDQSWSDSFDATNIVPPNYGNAFSLQLRFMVR